VLIGVVILVLAAAVLGTRYWVLQQYYVAADESGEVAIFQGVQGSALVLSLHRRVEGSCPPGRPGCRPRGVQDFSRTARMKLHSGITGLSGLDGARAKVSQLERQYLLPPCRERGRRHATRHRGRTGPARQPAGSPNGNCRKAR
jgi:protein phosphatase